MKKTSAVLIWLFYILPGFAQLLPPPANLTCELLRFPESAVITDPDPEFGWIVPQSGGKQTAYRLLVASSPFWLQEGKADLWDSGKKEDSGSVNISYNGKPLAPFSDYWWQVKVWASDGLESDYSMPQAFHTGNFDRSGLDYPGQSNWVELGTGNWVSENRQSASFQRFDPVYIKTPAPGIYLAGFEKSAIGILEFTATASEDHTPITIHLGERKYEDFTVHKDPGKSNIGYEKVEMTLKKGTHHYVLKLAERPPSHYLHTQKLAPHYPEVLPFRYVEITGDAHSYQLNQMQQAALFYYFDDHAARFSCSDSNLNEVWNLCKYTLKATPFLGVYADGNRERMPYEADAYIQQLGHYTVDREYSIGKYTVNFLLDHASWPTEWQMHTVLMAWEDYMQTGDAELLHNRYEDLKRKSLIDLAEPNGLISTLKGKKTQAFLTSLRFPGPVEQFRDIVDWPQGPKPGQAPARNASPKPGGETDGYVYTDFNTVVNAFHYRSLVLMERIAKVVGNEADQKFFSERAAQHSESFIKNFFDKKRGIFKDGESTDHASLHANMFALAFGLVPEQHLGSVAAFVKSRGMACSVYGAQYLLDALYEAGEADYALSLMTADSLRSWRNMIRVGSSMTTEAWDEYFKPNLTWNHAWGSAPANITARKLMGIEPLEPTFRRFRISPQPGKLENAAIKMPCIRGSISCDISQTQAGWRMNVSIPGNTEAEVWLPAQFTAITIDGQKISPIRTEKFAGGKRQVFTLKSGNFEIVAN